MKNLHLLPTDKPSRLHLIENALTITSEYKNSVCDSEVNIYITSSDEEIKEGDWCYGLFAQKPFILSDFENVKINFPEYKSEYKKIILTTDQALIADGVQEIDNTFAEWFVKNPTCEEVEIKVEFIQTPDNLKDGFYYKIIIPKEPKLINNCPKCGLDLIIREHCTPTCTDIDCRGIILSNETLREWASKEEPKQETLEETFRNYVNERYHFPIRDSYPDLESAKFGAKWQQERMYSEEDMIDFAFNTYCYISKIMNVPFNQISENKLHAIENLKQFKKRNGK
jgi:hypothetical protein